MGHHLEVFLLGNSTFKLDGQSVEELTSRKATALFIYLLCNPDQTFSRDLLADLFYSQLPQERVRANLSVLLSRLGPLSDYLHTTRQTVAFNPDHSYWLDALTLEKNLVSADPTAAGKALTSDIATQLEATLDLYQGDFLAGFYLANAQGFEEWAALERERLQRLTVKGLERLVNHCLATGQYQAGLKPVGRLLQLEPLHEPAHRHRMTMLARLGQRNEALAHYRACCHTLAEELGIEPSVETTALYQRIRETTGRPRHNLPAPLTSFLGREAELSRVARRLHAPSCRLLTVIGSGGVGKTRLGLEVARRQLNSFWHGVWFVPLVAVDSADQLLLTLAQVFNLTFPGSAEPKTQLLQYLQDREVLLLLDSFEYLLSSRNGTDGTELLVDILQTAPAVKMLVTSRERLNLHSEWILPLNGLSVPARPGSATLVGSDAAQLLVERGRQVRPGLRMSDLDGPAIAHVCRLVGGIPLAIELAAGWLNLLSWAEIAAEIEQNLDFLRTTQQDLPERQRNIRAVLEHSWQSLSEIERWMMRQLAVFRGGFRREAVEVVLGDQGATVRAQKTVARDHKLRLAADKLLPLLSQLVDKSLLQVTPIGRYQLYPLVRQFAAEKLVFQSAEQAQVQARHGRYYAAFLKQREAGLREPRQTEALAEIEEEVENIRAAWQWAINGRHVAEIGLCLESLAIFYFSRHHYDQAEEVFEESLATLQRVLGQTLGHASSEIDQAKQTLCEREITVVFGTALLCQAHFLIYLGRLEHAERVLKRCLALLRPTGEYRPVAFGLNLLGLTMTAQGNYDQARVYVEESLKLAKANDDQWLPALTLGCLGQCVRRQDYMKTIAQSYTGNGLIAEAIAMLEALVEDSSQQA
jgi:predicted ATPase